MVNTEPHVHHGHTAHDPFLGRLVPDPDLVRPISGETMLTTQLYGEQCLRTCHWQAATASPAHTQLGSNLVRALAGMP